ncbi:MAG: LamG-like jellyroll fold domain-containing protein [Thiohalomonadales bacterium]
MEVKNRKLSLRMTGKDVAKVQRNLSKLGFKVPSEEKKKKYFGKATRQAVSDFQKFMGLKITGEVDSRTLHALEVDINALLAKGGTKTAVKTKKSSLPVIGNIGAVKEINAPQVINLITPPASIFLSIIQPSPDGVTVQGPTLLINGSASGSLPGDGTEPNPVDIPVTVTVSISGARPIVLKNIQGNWSAQFEVTTRGPLTITATASTGAPGAKTIIRPIVIDLDSTSPELLINSPQDGDRIPGTTDQFLLTLSGTASASGQQGIQWVKYHLDGEPFSRVNNDSGDWATWSRQINLITYGPHIITVWAKDNFGNINRKAIQISTRDDDNPILEITSHYSDKPKRLTWSEEGITEAVRGTAKDDTTSVQSVQWNINNGVSNDATDISGSGDWGLWRFDIDIPSPGLHDISVKATDLDGNEDIVVIQLDVAVPFKLEDLGTAAYLQDLISFAYKRVKTAISGEKITSELLSNTFHQPFARLIDPNFQEAAEESVHQVRISIEVLRGFLNNQSNNVDYCRAAYRNMLINIGTSYEEIRLIRVADDDSRDGLATRLAISVEYLDRLFLQPSEFTETNLHRLFGIADTTVDTLIPASSEEPELLAWQRSHLRTLWREQIQRENARLELPLPVIDPDVVDVFDLVNPTEGNTAYDILLERSQWVENKHTIIKQARESISNTLEGFEIIITMVLPGIELEGLALEYAAGEDIKPRLNDFQLYLQPFFLLLRVRRLAATNIVLDAEWENVYAILVQVEKQRVFSDWIQQESSLILGPNHFKRRDSVVDLPPWRATWRKRRNWEKTLDARISQRLALKQALKSAIDATEASTMPLLRDTFISAIDRQGYPEVDVADWLTQRLSISFKYSGDQKISRLEQAIETLQDVLFSLRTGRFESLSSLPVGTPVPLWQLATDETYKEDHFDVEWDWMGSYATWRGAMFVFGYPENYLLPNLRPKSLWTSGFRDLIKDLRSESRLTAKTARKFALAYLTKENLSVCTPEQKDLPELPDTCYLLTDQLTKDDLKKRRTQSKQLLKQFIDSETGGLSPETPLHLTEVFYFVPMALALSLQRSGEYLSALDWFQTVYAYDLPANERKIYYGLELEESLPTKFERTYGWLLVGLNPYDIAVDRANAFSRFTLISLVRCFQAFADSEFATQTNESIPHARNLYLTALELLDLLEVPPAVAHWAFDKDEGTFAIDSTGNGHRAALNNTQWQAEGRRTGVLGFNRNAFAEVSHAPALALGKDNADFSVSFMIYLRAEGNSNLRSVFHKGVDNQQHTPSLWMNDNDNKLKYSITTTANNPDESSMSVNEIELDIWTHVAYVKEGDKLKLYMQGQFDSELVLQGEVVSNTAPLYMGKVPWSTNGVNALLDDVRVYDRALRREAVITLAEIDPFPANPVVQALQLHADLSLRKLRTGRNIAGMERPREELTAVEPVLKNGELISAKSIKPRSTAYRYSVLIERTKQLVNIAQQIEASFFTTLERIDTEAYSLLQARNDIQLTKASIELQDIRITEADGGISLAQLQQERAQTQNDKYQDWLDDGENQAETDMLKNYRDIRRRRDYVAGIDAALTVAQTVSSMSLLKTVTGTTAVVGGVIALIAGTRAVAIGNVNYSEMQAQINSFNASFERRKDEWILQKSLAQKDIEIGGQQIALAGIQKQVVEQERAISGLQSEQAEAVIEFLNNKFTNLELYEWMSDILSQVYSYFLQQATALAQLAQNQLAFERQERPPAFIQGDYWQISSDLNNQNNPEPDRRGLTGSARLLQDLYKLDLYAFDTNKRKLQLAQVFSLAQLAPQEFQQFRETGILPFETPMMLFDRGFPGHYLRLIKRVRVSVVALIPPTQGIRATLTSSGLSQVVTTDGNVFRVSQIRRTPEMIAFTSPMNATGMFELQQENEMLLPFEGMGVDTMWELRLPKAANPFDFDTIANVLVTIDYTAFHNFDYQQLVIRELDNTYRGEQAYSFRQDFPDLWYDLNNSNPEDSTISLQLETRRESFPPNLSELKIDHVILYFSRVDDATFEVQLTDLRFKAQGSLEPEDPSYGGAQSIEGIISTRRGSWTPLIGKPLFGTWTFEFPNTEQFLSRIKDEKITDILFVISYSGDTPAWPT